MRKSNTLAAILLTALMTVLSGCMDSPEVTLASIESEAVSSEEEKLTQPESTTGAALTDEAEDRSIFVYVCGCVENPGVYELPEGSRVCDVLEAAGGFSEGADEKRINLAGMLKDGDMVFFPEEGEALAGGASDYVQSGYGNEAAALVNINTAGEDALCTLPGIGSSKAQAIVRYREEHGSFKDIKEIMNVNGIGENLFKQIEALICV